LYPYAFFVPSIVVPPFHYLVSFSPSSPVPRKLGSFPPLLSSDLDDPESEAASRSGALGAAGAVVSIVTTSEPEATLVLPARSVWVAGREWGTSPSGGLGMVPLPWPSAVVVASTVVPARSCSVQVC